MLFSTVLVAPVSFANGFYHLETPQITNVSNGSMSFKVKVNITSAAYMPKVYWVVTSSGAVNLSAQQIMDEAIGTTSIYTIKGEDDPLADAQWTNLSTETAVLTNGEAYKLQIALGEFDANSTTYYVSNGSETVLPFENFDYLTAPSITNRTANSFTIGLNMTTGGAVYAAAYPYGSAIPTASEIVNSSGSALAFATTSVTSGSPAQLTLTSESLKPNVKTDIYLVRVDGNSNSLFSSSPTFSGENTTGLTLLSANYNNNTAANLADDQIVLHFSGALSNPGTASDFNVCFANNTQVFVEPTICLTPGTDFTFGSYEQTGFTVNLNITAAGLAKFNDAASFDNGIMRISTVNNSTFIPYVSQNTYADFPLTQYIIDAPDLPYLASARYNDAQTTALTDDSIELTFTTANVTNPGLSSDYLVEIDTHSTGTYTSADITLTSSDYTVSASSDKVILSFTEAGRAKIPTSGLSFWKISIVNPTNLTPDADATKPYEIFAKNNFSTQLAQIMFGGIPLTGFDSNVYEYFNVEVPYSAFQTLQGNYSSLVTPIPMTAGTTYDVIHDSATGTEKIYVMAEGLAEKIYTIHTVVNKNSLSGINIAGSPMPNFNKFLTTFPVVMPENTTIIPTLTATTDNPSAVVLISGSGSLPGVYTYTITVTSDGVSKIYLVVLSSSSPHHPGTNDDDNTPYYPNYPTSTTPDTTYPPSVTDADLKYFENLFTQPDFFSNPLLFEQSMTNLYSNTLKIQNEAQLFQSLSKFDALVGSMSTLIGTPNDSTKVVNEVVNMSQLVEQRIQDFSNPQDALQVVDSYLSELAKISTKVGDSNLQIEKSALDMLQKVADKASAVPVTVGKNETKVTVDTKAVDQALTKQIEFLKSVNTLSDKYFGAENVNKISTKITLEIKRPDEMKQLATTIPPEVLQQLSSGGIDKLKVQVGGAGLTLNNSEISQKENLVVDMKFIDAPSGSAGLPDNQKIVDFNVLAGEQPVNNFQKPIEISFKYADFGVDSSDLLNTSIFRFNEDAKNWDNVAGIVDKESGSISTKRTHLSQYTVMKSKKSFSDANNSWAKNEINSLLNKGIVNASEKFEPQANLTRGEFAAWISKAYGLEASTKALPFKDVAKTNENYSAIAAVYNQGIISGKSKTKFEPDGYITEQEMAVIMGRTLVAFSDKKTNTKTQSKYLSSLKDKDVASWAQQDVALLMELGISNSKDLAKGNAYVTKETAAASFVKVYN